MEPHVEVFRRTAEDRWELWEWRAGKTVELASIEARFAVDELYRDPLAG